MQSVYLTSSKYIIKQLEKYNILSFFSSEEELNSWIESLNDKEIKNFLNLRVEPSRIHFLPELLINRNLLNTDDYLKRVETFISIKNAKGREHLFINMLNPEFLNSPKFYQDIETLKRAKSAQMPLWIIGDTIFINSPFHDEDFELLVTSFDTSDKDCDFLVWDAIATVARNIDSINSGYHQSDLKTIIKYSAPALQTSSSFPEGSLNNLAISPVSLKDPYHLENMELLANNQEIGNFLYAIMASSIATKRRDYRIIIREMIEHKDNEYYAFLLCIYVLGVEEAKKALNVTQLTFLYRIEKQYDLNELLNAVYERLCIIDGNVEERYLLETSETPSNPSIKKSFWSKFKRDNK